MSSVLDPTRKCQAVIITAPFSFRPAVQFEAELSLKLEPHVRNSKN